LQVPGRWLLSRGGGLGASNSPRFGGVNPKIRRNRLKCARALLMAGAFALLSATNAFAEQESGSSEAEKLHAEVDRLYSEGRFDEAIPLAERALSIQERSLGPDDPRVVQAINSLAMLYRAAGDYVGAESLFERVLEITTEALGPRDPTIAITVNNLGMVYWEQGDRERAAQYLEKALEIWEHALGPDHPNVAVALGNLASLYRRQGNLERAEPLYERALAIWGKSPDPVQSQLVDTLRNLGAIRQNNSDYERAESFFKRALALDEKAYGVDHAGTAVALSRLASLYYESGDYAAALPLLERVLAIQRGAHGPDSTNVASALSNLAAVHLALGDHASAEPLFEQALEIRSKALGSDHLAVAASLENLASLYRAQGEYARSRRPFARALTIRVKSMGPGHLDVASTTSHLGAVDWALGDFESAKPLFERALLVREKALGTEHPLVATSVDNVASVYRVLGKDDEVRPLYEAALAIREKTFGREHPTVAQSLRNLGLMHWGRGDWEQAEAYLARTAETEERQFSLLLPVQFETRARAYMEALSTSTNLILSFQRARPDSGSATRLAFTTVLRRKGRDLRVAAGESIAHRQRLNAAERAAFDQLVARRNELGRLIVRGHDRPRSASVRVDIEKLRREVDDLESAALNGEGALRSWVAPIQIEDIQSKIPAGAALVELVEYWDLDPTRISADRVDETARLAAFVLHSAGEPRWVPLGRAAAIHASARAFREALVDTKLSPEKLRKRGRDLYDRLAAPLEPHLEGIRTVWVATDGGTVLIPFGALIDPDGRYWVERTEFVYLTSGRDLLLSKSALPSQRPPLVVAAPDYDAELPAGAQASAKSAERRSPESAALRFPPLASSQTGASEVARLLGVTPLTGAQASAAALKSVRAPRVLHVAVDGFFLPDPIPERTARWGSILGIDPQLRPPASENPLLRSGFALAGANRGGDDADRGLMTAQEIASLDLWGTQLVGIAARGIKSGETSVDQAVYALRRSVVLAGAEAQFANLWTTDPRAAAELAAAYYGRLLAGEDRSEALRGVQLEMLRSENHSHPFYWAGFIPMGARGPIVWGDAREAGEEISGSP
jgi:tetratricopeptide (TPR) repeat protein